MYSIEKKPYGYKLTFGGAIPAEEMSVWVKESKSALLGSPKEFGVLVDMRTLKPIGDDSQKHMQEGQKLYKQSGMSRSAVILSSLVTKMQFQRLAKETGIYAWERYLDASSTPEWEKIGIDWLTKGTDPDK